jgi:hypothetical protein
MESSPFPRKHAGKGRRRPLAQGRAFHPTALKEDSFLKTYDPLRSTLTSLSRNDPKQKNA